MSRSKLNFFGRFGEKIVGSPFIGQFIRFLHFKKAIKPLRFKSVLDVGCGSGDYAFYLAKKYPEVKIEACDISIKKNY